MLGASLGVGKVFIPTVDNDIAGLEQRQELLDKIIDRLARHYTGAEYRVRDRARVSVHVEIERWHGWGAMRQD